MHRPSPHAPTHAPDGAGASVIAALPAWDLTDLYPAPDSPALEADFTKAAAAAKAFQAAYAGKLDGLPGAALAIALQEYERIEETLGRLASYAQLLFSQDGTDPVLGQFYQSVSERVTTISSDLIFLSLELKPDRRRGAGDEAQGSRFGALPAIPARSPGLASRTSSRTSWRSCCTKRRSPAGRPGPACSMRRWPACASRSGGRS